MVKVCGPVLPPVHVVVMLSCPVVDQVEEGVTSATVIVKYRLPAAGAVAE